MSPLSALALAIAVSLALSTFILVVLMKPLRARVATNKPESSLAEHAPPYGLMARRPWQGGTASKAGLILPAAFIADRRLTTGVTSGALIWSAARGIAHA
jgi:hypothetical protein